MNDIIILLCWETDTSNSIGKEQTVDVEKTHLSLCVCVCNICNEWGLYKRYKLQNDKKLLQVRLSDLETSSTTLWCVLSVQFLDCTISWVYCYLSVHVLCWICAVYSVLVSGSKQFTVNLSIIYTIFACWKVLLRFCQTLCYVQYLHQFCEHFFFISPIWQPNIVSFTELWIFSRGDEVEWVWVLLCLCTNWNGCLVWLVNIFLRPVPIKFLSSLSKF